MKWVLCFILNLFVADLSLGQTVKITSITGDLIGSNSSTRAGSCDSPNGFILDEPLPGYPPNFEYLDDNGFCFENATPIKNATYCYSFVSPGTFVELNAGIAYNWCASFSLWFSDFELYTCEPDCSLIGTGLIFTGLTSGQCYTWCFDTHFTGCGPSGGFTSICPYMVYDGPLPVQLIEFTSIRVGQSVELRWTTLSEVNNAYFDILRSFDGINFTPIGQVAGNGTSTTEESYSYMDYDVLISAYYMLRQTDYEGHTVDSKIIFSDLFASNPFEINYYTIQGIPIKIENAPSGIIIKEELYSRGEKRYSTFYHSK